MKNSCRVFCIRIRESDVQAKFRRNSVYSKLFSNQYERKNSEINTLFNLRIAAKYLHGAAQPLTDIVFPIVFSIYVDALIDFHNSYEVCWLKYIQLRFWDCIIRLAVSVIQLNGWRGFGKDFVDKKY